MDPLILYVLLVAATVALIAMTFAAARPPTRSCLNCGAPTPVQAKRCRKCGYRPARPV